MGLFEQAILDARQISSDAVNGFGVSIEFTAPNADTATINGLYTKHRVNVDQDGLPTNAKKASVTVSEKLLTDLGYPVRNSQGDVYLESHRVKVKDAEGVLYEYVVREWFPDETLGLIVCILGDYEA